MEKSVIDAFNQCVDVSADVRSDLAKNVYSSKYLGMFMTLVHEFNGEFRFVATQYFLEDVAARYAHSDINNEAGIRAGLLDLYDRYFTNRRIIDFDLKTPFFEMVNHYYIENLGGRYNPAKDRNYVNGYLLTDVIKSDQDIEAAINNSILHGDASCDDIDNGLVITN
ncbi:hypothetical protein MOO44_00075 (plasmid) [Nicoliella spurrieriana]|uniref:Uncharacterized protein n=1 Tax=Nicoliella spurrieriana TaxID=2925830 RepID=A0A976RR30_9LACO|nr:hypothetical protein [Nicoliella spurrieriana]UQS86076.1 hypothetical protein MOO44_00075 [Nicoliella spurrieriana]